MENSTDRYKDMTNVGNEIMDSVNRAISSGDFSKLNQEIGDSVKKAGAQFKSYTQTVHYTHTSDGQSESHSRQERSVYDIPEMAAEYVSRFTGKTPYFQKKISRNRGTVSLVIGILGAAFWGFSSLLFLDIDVGIMLFSVVLTALHAGLIARGVKLQNLVKRYFKYGDIIGKRQYYDIKDLSELCSEPLETTVKNLQGLNRKDYFQYMRITEDNRTVCLTKDAYDECSKYSRQQAENRQAETEAADVTQTSETENTEKRSEEVQQILAEGNKYLASIKWANDEIPDENMSKKLDRLAAITERIFEAVKKDPSTASGLRRFMTYYLPTTDKLLKAYVELDHQPEGPNVEKTKKQIEDSMDTIISAYENLLDSMFEDLSFDVASDISVMNTMLKQDGLAGEKIRDQS